MKKMFILLVAMLFSGCQNNFVVEVNNGELLEKSSTTRTIDLRGDYYWYNEEKISLAPVLATTLSSTEDSEVVFYRNPEGNQIGVTNKFGVVLKSEKDVVKLEQLAADNGIFLYRKG